MPDRFVVVGEAVNIHRPQVVLNVDIVVAVGVFEILREGEVHSANSSAPLLKRESERERERERETEREREIERVREIDREKERDKEIERDIYRDIYRER